MKYLLLGVVFLVACGPDANPQASSPHGADSRADTGRTAGGGGNDSHASAGGGGVEHHGSSSSAGSRK